MNAYTARSQAVIPAVLIYPQTADALLMMHRDRSPADKHFGKYNGLGGKLELGESPWTAATRELLEESGLHANNRLKMVGSLYFPQFKPEKREDWWVSVFTVELTSQEMQSALSFPCPEGSLKRIQKTQVLNLPLWEGDAQFIPLVLEHRPFFGTLRYSPEGTLMNSEIFKF